MFIQSQPGKVIRIANKAKASLVRVNGGGDEWILNGQVIAYRQANGLAGNGDKYFVLATYA
jgi:hypothetical protein